MSLRVYDLVCVFVIKDLIHPRSRSEWVLIERIRLVKGVFGKMYKGDNEWGDEILRITLHYLIFGNKFFRVNGPVLNGPSRGQGSTSGPFSRSHETSHVVTQSIPRGLF